MQEVEKEFNVKGLLSKNIPFVAFREPGKPALLVIQEQPITEESNLEIKEKGFYIFPFSLKEKSRPIFISPDHVVKWESRKNLRVEFDSLEKLDIPPQNLFEISRDQYEEDIEKYLNKFHSGNLKKAIYSRIKKEKLESDFDLEAFFDSMISEYPRAFVYMMNIPGNGVWIGASPELLLSFTKGSAKTVALAGTLKQENNLSSPNWTRKEIDEHRLVEKHIIKVCENLGIPYKKSGVRSSSTGKVYHLKSDFEMNLFGTNLGEFLARLHPTPAISGLPKEESIDLIYEVEKHERGYYCGFLGWVEDSSQFDLYINLRCMKITDQDYYLFAGGGITPESDVDQEWEETVIKMSTLADLMPSALSLSPDNH